MACLFAAAIQCNPGPRPGVVLLDFWATWCAPYRASGPALADLAGRFGSNDAAVVGISADEDEQAWRRYIGVHAVRRLEVRDGGGKVAGPRARRYICVHAVRRLEVRDGGGKVADRFNVNGRPTFVLLDREGRVRWKQTGWTLFSYLVLRYRVGKLITEPG